MSFGLGWGTFFSLKIGHFQARQRLGVGVFADLFPRIATPVGVLDIPDVWLAGRRLVAFDGANLAVADTPANGAHFGSQGVNYRQRAAFPMTSDDPDDALSGFSKLGGELGGRVLRDEVGRMATAHLQLRVCPINGVWGPAVFISGWFSRTVRRR